MIAVTTEQEPELLDPRWALSLGESNGDLGLPVRRMVAGVVRSGEAQIQKTLGEILSGQREEARRQLHGLRGSFGSLGAMRLVAHSRALEEALKAPASPEDSEYVERWRATLQATLRALAEWSSRFPPVALPGDHPPTPTQRRRWVRMLGELDPHVLDELKECEEWLLQQFANDQADNLHLAIQRADLANLFQMLRPVLETQPTPRAGESL